MERQLSNIEVVVALNGYILNVTTKEKSPRIAQPGELISTSYQAEQHVFTDSKKLIKVVTEILSEGDSNEAVA